MRLVPVTDNTYNSTHWRKQPAVRSRAGSIEFRPVYTG